MSLYSDLCDAFAQKQALAALEWRTDTQTDQSYPQAKMRFSVPHCGQQVARQSLTLTLTSDYGGQKEILEMMLAVRLALRQAVGGFCWRLDSEELQEQQGPCRFMATLVFQGFTNLDQL